MSATTVDTKPVADAKVAPKSKAKSSEQKKTRAERASASESEAQATLQKLLSFDREMSAKWLKKEGAILIGTDEVGRGCLAGPVVAAAVHLSDLAADSSLASMLCGLNDSKKMQAAKRTEISDVLKANCRYAIAEASVEEIDEINILRASLLAMKRALAQLSPGPSTVILVDGNQKIDAVKLRQLCVIGGDGVSASIAAASILAKVHRDQFMIDLHNEFPHYKWDSNKGYGSKDHRDGIQEHGLTVWHRRSFCAKLTVEQLSLLPENEAALTV